MSNQLREVSVTELRRDLPNILDRVFVQKETVIVSRHGLPFATLSPITDEEAIQGIKKSIEAGMFDAVDAQDVLSGEKASAPDS